MKEWKYPKETVVRVNDKAQKGMRFTVEQFGIVVEHLQTPLYDYEIKLEDGSQGKYKEEELDYCFGKEDVLEVIHNGEKGKVVEVDIRYKHVELLHGDGGYKTYNFSQVKLDKTAIQVLRDEAIEALEILKEGKFEGLGREIGSFTDMKNRQYGSSVDATYEMIKVLMERYRYDESHYLIPEELLLHILLQARMMDKQNRIFNNPSGEGDSESPYYDLAGYSLIGIDMMERSK